MHVWRHAASFHVLLERRGNATTVAHLHVWSASVRFSVDIVPTRYENDARKNANFRVYEFNAWAHMDIPSSSLDVFFCKSHFTLRPQWNGLTVRTFQHVQNCEIPDQFVWAVTKQTSRDSNGSIAGRFSKIFASDEREDRGTERLQQYRARLNYTTPTRDNRTFRSRRRATAPFSTLHQNLVNSRSYNCLI